MKLKKNVKVVLVNIVVIALIIAMGVALTKDSDRAYDKCMIENNNNRDYCFELIR